MTRHMHQNQTPKSSMPFSAATLFSKPMFDAAAQVGQICGKACAEWQQEIARFITSRLESDSQAGQQLLNYRDWTDAAQIQQEWVTAAVKDYVDEATRIAELSSTLSTRLLQPFGMAASTGENDEALHRTHKN